jgi:hypothetical protein
LDEVLEIGAEAEVEGFAGAVAVFDGDIAAFEEARFEERVEHGLDLLAGDVG